MNKIRQWIQNRRDERFRRQLERVFTNYKINASPIFDGYLLSHETMVVGKEWIARRPLDRIRQDIEHPDPKRFVIGGNQISISNSALSYDRENQCIKVENDESAKS